MSPLDLHNRFMERLKMTPELRQTKLKESFNLLNLLIDSGPWSERPVVLCVVRNKLEAVIEDRLSPAQRHAALVECLNDVLFVIDATNWRQRPVGLFSIRNMLTAVLAGEPDLADTQVDVSLPQ